MNARAPEPQSLKVRFKMKHAGVGTLWTSVKFFGGGDKEGNPGSIKRYLKNPTRVCTQNMRHPKRASPPAAAARRFRKQGGVCPQNPGTPTAEDLPVQKESPALSEPDFRWETVLN